MDGFMIDLVFITGRKDKFALDILALVIAGRNPFSNIDEFRLDIGALAVLNKAKRDQVKVCDFL
jgi:hypothetical protein